jgi:hypothetical protein
MTVQQLIEALHHFPKDSFVCYEGGEFKDDWRPILQVYNTSCFGQRFIALK